jgi:hypothetical protein
LIKRPDLSRAKLERTRDLINETIDDCLVEGYESLIKTLQLPDPGDCHILAAAIKSHAQIIVTYNRTDFPDEILAPFGIESQHPDEFLMNQLDLQPGPFLSVVKRIRASLQKPPMNPEKYLDVLRKHSLAKTAEFLTAYLDLI